MGVVVAGPAAPDPFVGLVQRQDRPAGDGLVPPEEEDHVHHAVDHRTAIGLIHVFRRGHRVIRQRRSGGTTDPRQRGLNQRTPRRIGWRLCEHRTPDRRRFRDAAVLLGGKAEEIARLDLIRVLRDGALEFSLGF